MTAIADLPRSTTTPTSSDAVPYAKGGTGSAYTFTLAQLLEFFQGNFADPSYTRLTFAPANGATIDLTGQEATNLYVVISPTASPIATLTIAVPSTASDPEPFDGQTIVVVGGLTGAVTALSFTGPGTDGVPPNLATDGAFVIRYDATLERWKCIAATAGAVGNYPTVTLGTIQDTNANEEVVFVATASAVNHVQVTNAATGNAPIIEAVGDNANVNLQLQGKGVGTVLLGSILNTQTNAIRQTSVAVASLPSAVSSPGSRMVVNDSNAALTAGIGAIVAAGGANIVPVFSDGTNWRIG